VSRMLAPATASDVTEDIQLPRWASDSDTVSLIAEKVTGLKLTANDALVLDIFSNMAFMGTDPDGLPARPHRGMDGRFHISGHLEGATAILLKTNLAASVPVISASNGAKVVFVLPTPRYFTSQCCSNSSHLVNRQEADFSSIVMAVSQTVKGVLEAEITKKGWPAVIFDPMSSFEVSEDPAKTASSSGMSIWLPNDGVHLTATAYMDVHNCLQQQLTNPSTATEPGSGSRPSFPAPARLARPEHPTTSPHLPG
jgi:hypothetical protein